MAEATFFRCNGCDNLVAVLEKGACTPQCCGKPMEELVAGSTDAATEKHIPQVSREDGTIVAKVGSVEHPMLEKHSIQWVALAEPDRLEVRFLHPGEKPEARFADDGASDVTIYEYCNLHGLWKADL